MTHNSYSRTEHSLTQPRSQSHYQDQNIVSQAIQRAQIEAPPTNENEEAKDTDSVPVTPQQAKPKYMQFSSVGERHQVIHHRPHEPMGPMSAMMNIQRELVRNQYLANTSTN